MFLGIETKQIFSQAKWFIPPFVKTFCAGLVFSNYVGWPYVVWGSSMLPTMDSGYQLILEYSWAIRRNYFHIQRGDLVTHRTMYDPMKYACKRVVGLPGDVICVYPEDIYILQNEVKPKRSESVHVIVPVGHIWVSGDNVSNSRDSREFGPIPIGLVRGKVVARVMPGVKLFGNPITYIDD